MTPAEVLRKAAERIREVAAEASPGPWTVGEFRTIDSADQTCIIDVYDGYGTEGDAVHVALWNPTVALLVGDWLESEADGADYEAANSIYGAAGNDFVYNAGDGHPALKLASAILAVPDAA